MIDTAAAEPVVVLKSQQQRTRGLETVFAALPLRKPPPKSDSHLQGHLRHSPESFATGILKGKNGTENPDRVAFTAIRMMKGMALRRTANPTG
jgi:hypothetical protein